MGSCCSKYSSAVKPLVSSEESLHDFNETQSISGQSRRSSTKEAWSVTERIEEKHQNVARFGLVEVAIDAVTGQPVIVISRCRFPSKKVFNQKNILEYLTYTLDKYVESDYTIVYLHYSPNDENRPSFSWLKEAYSQLERKYKKNLKCLYIVHPTSAIRILWNLFKPVLSAKFGRKLRYVNFLYEIASDVSLQQLPIPPEILQYDKYLIDKENPTVIVTSNEEKLQATNLVQQFGVSLQTLEERCPDRTLPIVIQDTIAYLSENGLQAEGLFRKSASAIALETVAQHYDNGKEVVFDDPHLAAATLKSFLRKLPEPLLTFDFYQYSIDLMNLNSNDYASSLQNYLKQLPKRNYVALKYLLGFLVTVVDHSAFNLMTSNNLAIVFGPTLLWSTDEAASLTAVHTINNLIEMLISQFDQLFADKETVEDEKEN